MLFCVGPDETLSLKGDLDQWENGLGVELTEPLIIKYCREGFKVIGLHGQEICSINRASFRWWAWLRGRSCVGVARVS